MGHSGGKWIKLRKMGHTLKNGSQLENGSHLKNKTPIGKMGHTYKYK